MLLGTVTEVSTLKWDTTLVLRKILKGLERFQLTRSASTPGLEPGVNENARSLN